MTGHERLAALGLAAAAFGGVVSPWFHVAPWWPLSAAPALHPPWLISARVLGLLVVVGSLAAYVRLGSFTGTSLSSLVALALGTAAAASLVNNLPASALMAGMLGTRLLPASAALTGLSVGALSTPHGSVATLLAFERSGESEAVRLARS